MGGRHRITPRCRQQSFELSPAELAIFRGVGAEPNVGWKIKIKTNREIPERLTVGPPAPPTSCRASVGSGAGLSTRSGRPGLARPHVPPINGCRRICQVGSARAEPIYQPGPARASPAPPTRPGRPGLGRPHVPHMCGYRRIYHVGSARAGRVLGLVAAKSEAGGLSPHTHSIKPGSGRASGPGGGGKRRSRRRMALAAVPGGCAGVSSATASAKSPPLAYSCPHHPPQTPTPYSPPSCVRIVLVCYAGDGALIFFNYALML